ncbi:hypothetical protein MuYL_0650 [Mucilaginibacter xinganensis]|uniref:Uncharacterized protein n=1 Tax=Mucilaginibacter xinganensis TaxID=1234841 RepID=A0A223NRR6_9SPHI|nr:hypothetical protein MuYL_0650 [Mucilaginibacter xinganensis]
MISVQILLGKSISDLKKHWRSTKYLIRCVVKTFIILMIIVYKILI